MIDIDFAYDLELDLFGSENEILLSFCLLCSGGMLLFSPLGCDPLVGHRIFPDLQDLAMIHGYSRFLDGGLYSVEM